MPLHSLTARNTMLDNMWDNVPAFEVGLLASDPRITGTVDEVPEAGRVAGTAADWAPASGGRKRMSAKTLPAPTGAWSATAERWGIWVAGELWDHGRLEEPIAVTAAGAGPAIRPTVGFNERLVVT